MGETTSEMTFKMEILRVKMLLNAKTSKTAVICKYVESGKVGEHHYNIAVFCRTATSFFKHLGCLNR